MGSPSLFSPKATPAQAVLLRRLPLRRESPWTGTSGQRQAHEVMPPSPTPHQTLCQDRAQCLLSSHVTASEQFVTELGMAEFPNVTRKNILKNSKYFKLQLFRDQPSVRISKRTRIQMEGRTSLSHPSWAPSTHLLHSRYHPIAWS